eukprot:gene12365-15546_t
MDVEPIYCAEQIAVPVDLADVLKAYTKEVIRRQPENLVEFSAKYFTSLANVAASEEAEAPSREQLQQVYERAGGAASLSSSQVGALCQQSGINKEPPAIGSLVRASGMVVWTEGSNHAAGVGALRQQSGIDKIVVGKVMEVGEFEAEDVSIDKFLFLLLAMTCDSFSSVVSGIFTLFGFEIDAQRFVTLISHLAPDMDPEVTTQFMADLSSSLMDVPTVSYDSKPSGASSTQDKGWRIGDTSELQT